MALCIMVKYFHFRLICPKDVVPDVLWFALMKLSKPNPSCHIFWRIKGFLFAPLTNKPYFFSICLILLSWTFNIYLSNMLGLEVFYFFEHCTVWPWGELLHLNASCPLNSYGNSKDALSFSHIFLVLSNFLFSHDYTWHLQQCRQILGLTTSYYPATC